ncbi:MAG: tRNA(Ile)(2)-agmatinylcytidine synthase [Pyrobaculum sp.]
MRVYIGIDDTDSHRWGCTTYVGYILAKEVIKRWGRHAFLDFPRLVRLNPNVPFKTRGNAAVALALEIPEGDIEELWRLAVEVVSTNADFVGKTSPGLAMAVGEVPERARLVYRHALTQIVSIDAAERAGLATWGGRGKIGAVAAVGAEWRKSTFELIAYRGGDRAPIPLEAVKTMDLLTYPYTFHNYDKKRVLIQPRGPDPVYYGVRGITPHHLLWAKHYLDQYVKPTGWVIYRTNQATDAHLELGVFYKEPLPYSYYIARGLVVEARRTKTRHLLGRLDDGLEFVVYRHLGGLAGEIERCRMCYVELRGGLKPRGDKLFLYVESGVVLGRYIKTRPRCVYCGGSLESLGRSGARRCRKCGTVYHTSEIKWLYVRESRYIIPRPGMRRHLLRPPGLDVEIPNYFSPGDVEWIG